MGKCFLLRLKSPFQSEDICFFSDFFCHVGRRLNKKLSLISKSMTSQSAEQIITIHISFNISRNKEYWTIKFGQLIENDIRNIFIEKSYTK